MIPILYDAGEMEFQNNGIGALADVISCTVTEERNGEFELEMEYPETGLHYSELKMSRIIYAVPGDGRNAQGFRIYKISKPIGGTVTVNAEHISYQLASIPVSKFSADSAADAMTGLKNNAAAQCPFTFWTDLVSSGDFSVDAPASIRSKLGGSEGSVLDVYGGEYEWDNFTVRLWAARGHDNGVVLRYGKNITDIKQEENITNTITGLYPYWEDSDGNYVELNRKVVLSPNAQNFPYPRIETMDCSSEFDEQPSKQALLEWAENYIDRNNIGVPSVNIKVSFVALWQTEEYKDIAPLERVRLCDTVTVDFPKLGISAKAKVSKTVYNVLLDRYDSIEIGDARTNLASDMVSQQQQIDSKPSTSFLQQAVENATSWITGGRGGYIVFQLNANGQPDEFLIMDTPDINTAQKVWRWNQGGLGYSGTGYNGPYTTAITQDGAIVADFITSGTMMANIIKGGILLMGGRDNGNGVFEIRNSAGELIGRWDKDGIMAETGTFAGMLQAATGTFAGALSAATGTFAGMLQAATGTFLGAIASSSAIITGGHIDIATSDTETSIIHLAYQDAYAEMASGYVKVGDATGASQIFSGSITSPVIEGERVYATSYAQVNGSARIMENLDVLGTKNRRVITDDHGEILQYCYEMASPMFGDAGTGELYDDGKMYVHIDERFKATIADNQEYFVFLQCEGQGELWVAEKNQGYFVVCGTPGLKFAWEIKAKQLGYETDRLGVPKAPPEKKLDYTAIANRQIENRRNAYRRELMKYNAQIKNWVNMYREETSSHGN